MLWGRGPKKPAGLSQGLMRHVVILFDGVGERQGVFGPCNGDVKQTAFFFQCGVVVPASDGWEVAVQQLHDIHVGPLKPFCTVNCREGQQVLLTWVVART